MDDRIALEIARELTNPAIAADQIEAAMRMQRNRGLSPQSAMDQINAAMLTQQTLKNPATNRMRAAIDAQRNLAVLRQSPVANASLAATRALGSEMSKRAEPASQNALTK
jgi:hypothetical protein